MNVAVCFFLLETSSGGPKMDVGVQTVDVWSRNGQKTAFARTVLKAGVNVSIVSVLIPVANSSASSSLPTCMVRQINEGKAAGGFVAQAGFGAGGWLAVTMDASGTWSVERGAAV
jgi:hypothetical protein